MTADDLRDHAVVSHDRWMLFGAKSQLFVYHFMFGPEDQEGCPSCSFWADHYDGAGLHLPHRDVSFVAVSRAPFDKIERYKRRMGWRFKWVSSANTDFNYDLGVSFSPEQLERGALLYNVGTANRGCPIARARACSTRIGPAQCSTRIRATLAASRR